MLMAGPCSVENKEMLSNIAKEVKKGGAIALRGGAYKPRTSPYDFQGLGEVALKYLREVADENNMLVVTEAMDVENLDLICTYSDIIQIGTRNVFRRPISSLVRAICDEGAAVIELEFTVEFIAYLFEPRPPDRVVVEEGGVPLLRLFLLESGVVLLVGVHAAPNDRSSLHPFAAVFSYPVDLFRAQTERSLRHLKDLLEIFTPVSP